MPGEVSDALRPYLFHGLDMHWKAGDKDAQCECPFCDRGDGKFSVRTSDGRYGCFVCGAKGNLRTFLRWLWTESDKQTPAPMYVGLAHDRKLQNPDTIMAWGACVSLLTSSWLVPGYAPDGSLAQLYKYAKNREGRMCLLATPGLGHQLFGVPLYDAKKPEVFLCEGPWDAMALWEALGGHKQAEEGITATANRDRSLLACASVLAVPGATVFFPKWTPLFAGKTVYLMYDSDHPSVNSKTGQAVAPAGIAGARRTAGILRNAKEPPRSVAYLRWGEVGYNKGLPSGWDVRDQLNA